MDFLPQHPEAKATSRKTKNLFTSVPRIFNTFAQASEYCFQRGDPSQELQDGTKGIENRAKPLNHLNHLPHELTATSSFGVSVFVLSTSRLHESQKLSRKSGGISVETSSPHFLHLKAFIGVLRVPVVFSVPGLGVGSSSLSLCQSPLISTR